MNPKLIVLNKLRNKESVIATFSVLRGVRNAQVLAHSGVDAVVIDCEHGHIGDADMHDMVAAVSGSGVSPIIRIRSADPETIKRALDTGTHGVLVPMVSTANEARDIVHQSKFPPLGVRGQGGPFTCFEHGLSTPADYVRAANDSVLLMMQIETREGLQNIEEICQVDGVDLVLIGPNDLALALMGRHPARPDDVDYFNAIEKIRSTGERYGKKTGIVVVDGETAQKALEKYDFVILSNEVRALQAWYKTELAVARS
ncbi:uncharacterized protein IL334_000031 [Kwoniella shivajii]|uniref:HpcH/HpaI aldolase/citrate lyase domain-containing protein n=1 Tax=Kwoniella shivajii TaxID=564305 RepID=A0ABZ1CN03_9TREE|nr:hypothetical protein IL334_000031 [Kwoniella shivajii]